MAVQNGHSEPNKLAVVVGFGIGITWLLMAFWCLYSGFHGYSLNRTDYGFLWTVVGVLLLGCGIAALIGTWWHQYPLKQRGHH